MKKFIFILLIVLFCFTSCATSASRGTAYTNIDVIIGQGSEWELAGILTMPEGGMPRGGYPAVVIVHGSGPGDMDGTAFAYKPYLDIADFLSSNGIAVLRYNKRTLTHGAKMVGELGGALTVYEETIEDAVLASALLKSNPRINENKVFMIGHSLGGMLAPRIQNAASQSGRNAEFAGLVLLAGSPRFLMDLSYDQNVDYIEKMMSGEEQAAARASLAGWDEQMNIIVNLPDAVAKTVDIQGGMSAYYLKDLYWHPVTMYIDDIRVPFLVLQGSADFQVSPEKDFALYKQLLSGRDNVTFILYEGLNHMFITSATGYIDEYEIPGNVDVKALQDITNWILAQ